MSYEQNSAKEAVQPTPKAVEYITTVPPIVWICVVLLGLMACGALPVSVGVFLCVAAILFVRHLDSQRVLEEKKARAAAFVNCIGPVMVCSGSPDEGIESIRKRAEAWRESLKMSGNPYWDKIPIIEYPYSPMLFETSQLSAGWNIYLHLADAKRHTENIKWYESKCPNDLKGLFASAVLPAPKMET